MDNQGPIICFGQQPCGFFPKRFLVAKINTAKKLRDDIGGRIVFFYHDSDADYRETITIMRDKSSGAEVRLNFTQENKLQKKFSPLYKKRIPAGWKDEILKQLPRFIDPSLDFPPLPLGEGAPMQRGAGEGLIEIFKSTDEKTVADFCLKMYKKMDLLDGIEVLRSSDEGFRQKAQELAGEYFADVEYQGETVRTKIVQARNYAELNAESSGTQIPRDSASDSATFREAILHEGGDKFIRFAIKEPIQKSQISAARDQRFAWMQSVINCTHYIYGEGEKEYLDTKPYPDIKFIDREKIDESAYAWLGQ